MTTIPYDIYDTDEELIVIAPFGGVQKESISISVQHEIITITWKRIKPILKKEARTLQQKSYRGDVEFSIDLPPASNYKNMKSKLTKENILILTIPKNIVPDHIPIHIEEEQ